MNATNAPPDAPGKSPRDPALSKLLQQMPTQGPPAHVDAAILAAARSEVAPRRQQRRWWQRFRAPLALAATVTLAIALSLTMQRVPPQPDVPPPAASVAQPMSPPAARTDDTPIPAGEFAEKAEVTAPSARSGDDSRKASRAPAPASSERAPAPLAPTEGSPADAANSRPPQPPPAAVPAEAVAPLSSTQPAVAPGATSGANPADQAASLTEARRPPSAPAPAAKAAMEAKREAATLRTPAAWLEQIRELRRLGKHDEAARELAAFRRAHPDYPLPEEFR